MHRILVIANETCPCPALLDAIAERARAHGEHEVRLVAPALNSKLRHWLSDSDEAVAAAHERLAAAADYLKGEGVDATGKVGDADPYHALHDELARFAADEVMLSTHPPERSHWLEGGLVERVQTELDVPVEHVVSAYGLVTHD